MVEITVGCEESELYTIQGSDLASGLVFALDEIYLKIKSNNSSQEEFWSVEEAVRYLREEGYLE